jgi:hypothetical protein
MGMPNLDNTTIVLGKAETKLAIVVFVSNFISKRLIAEA